MNNQFFHKVTQKAGTSARSQAIAFAKIAGNQMGIETPEKKAIKRQQSESQSITNWLYTAGANKDVLLDSAQEEAIKQQDIARAKQIEEEIAQFRRLREKETEEWKKQQDEIMAKPEQTSAPVMLPTSQKKGPQGPGHKPQKSQPLIVTQKQNKAETGRQSSG
jgi:hypothetical protein